jgi:hypothetical protein
MRKNDEERSRAVFREDAFMSKLRIQAAAGQQPAWPVRRMSRARLAAGLLVALAPCAD